MHLVKRTAALLAAAAAVAALAACSVPPFESFNADAVGTLSQDTTNSSPQAADDPGASPTATVGAQTANDACAGLQGIAAGSSVGGYSIIEMQDTGAAPHATGEAIGNDDGTLAAYVVADGDTVHAIARRFCVDYTPYLEWINSARRSDSWQWAKGDGSFPIYPGDTLNLDAHTITSVGDENGVVYDHTPDFNIPPQR